MLSYWEQETFVKDIDVAIVGSGIVGLSTAIEIKQNNPKYNVLILERGALPSGASTKNAGFTCFGSPSEILSDLKTMSTEEVLKLVEKRYKGLENLIGLLGKDVIDYQPTGSYEIFTETQSALYDECRENLDILNQRLKPLFGDDIYQLADEKISPFGFEKAKHLIYNKKEGTINTGKMMQKLISLASQFGIRILNGVEVKSFSEQPLSVELYCDRFEIQCKQLVIANNGFAKQLLPDLDLAPGRNQVVVTSPIDNLKFKGAFHLEEGYFYFRNIGNRVLLGGGRHLEKEVETTTELALTSSIQERLEKLLKTVILPDSKFEIETRWAGILGLGSKKTTIVEQLSSRVFVGVRMGGMGVAIGSLIGKELGSKIN